jgi:hypothetical protein
LQRAIVTGADGFLGRHLVRSLWALLPTSTRLRVALDPVGDAARRAAAMFRQLGVVPLAAEALLTLARLESEREHYDQSLSLLEQAEVLFGWWHWVRDGTWAPATFQRYMRWLRGALRRAQSAARYAARTCGSRASARIRERSARANCSSPSPAWPISSAASRLESTVSLLSSTRTESPWPEHPVPASKRPPVR